VEEDNQGITNLKTKTKTDNCGFTNYFKTLLSWFILKYENRSIFVKYFKSFMINYFIEIRVYFWSGL